MLTRQQIRDLMAVAARSESSVDSDRPYRQHDWRQCRYFSDQQISAIRNYLEKAGLSVSKALQRLCRLELQTGIQSIRQEYAQALIKSLKIDAQDYCMPFDLTATKTKGLLIIPIQAALIMAQWLLGGDQTTDTRQGLSMLEEALLTDCARAVIQALGDGDPPISMESATRLEKGAMGFMWDQMEAILSADMTMQQAGKAACQATVLMPCAAFSMLVGKKDCSTQTSSSDNSSIIMKYIEDLPVRLSAVLGTVSLKIADVVGLGIGDIVVLDKKIHEPVEILVEGREAFVGTPVSYRGQLAIKITK